MSKNLTVINRQTNKTVELSPKERRRIRKYEGKAFGNGSGVFPNFRLHLPYYASGINALFPYRPAVKDSDLLRPYEPVQDAYSEVGEVLHTTTPIEQPKAAAVEQPAKAKSKMTLELAREIRNNLHGSKASDIAKKLGLGETTVRDILKGKTWKEPIIA